MVNILNSLKKISLIKSLRIFGNFLSHITAKVCNLIFLLLLLLFIHFIFIEFVDYKENIIIKSFISNKS